MTKTTLLLSCLAISCSAFAAEPKAPVAPAAAVAPQTQAEKFDQLRAAKLRGEQMGACQKKAADQNLEPVEKKRFLTACLAGK
jgi:hypothetical protein